MDDDFIDALSLEDDINTIEAEDIGIPSEIKVIAPDIPDVKLLHDIPQRIRLDAVDIPKIIQVRAEKPIPEVIEIKGTSIPKSIELDASNVPRAIKLDTSDLPSAIPLEVPKDFGIKLDASDVPETIQVVGIPDAIELKGEIPKEIIAKLEVPENIEIPLVYKGGPVPLELKMPKGESDENGPCFMLVPCE